MTKRHVWLAVQAVATIVLLVLLFRRFDWAAFRAVLVHMSPAFYAGSLLTVVGVVWFQIRPLPTRPEASTMSATR